MKCPYCNHEMISGYVQSGRDIIWGKEKHKALFSATNNDDIIIAKGLNGSIKEAFSCNECKKIIIDYNKI